MQNSTLHKDLPQKGENSPSPNLSASGDGITCNESVADLKRVNASLYAALQALVNGRVRISDKANDILSEHDPKVIEARRVLAMANGALDLGSYTPR